MTDEEKAAAALLAQPRMTDVLSRAAVDLDTMMTIAPQLVAAAKVCSRCNATGACDAWIAQHPEGESHAPPEFCPNGELMRSLKPKRPDSE